MGKATRWDYCFEQPGDDPALRTRLAADLIRRGVSETGTRQALAGETVTDVADRLGLAKIVMRGLDQLAGTPRTLEIALLIPAVQSGLRKPTKPQAQRVAPVLEELGVSTMGAAQFLQGLPVAAPEDRSRLVRALAATLGVTWSGHHRGGLNMVMLDGSVR